MFIKVENQKMPEATIYEYERGWFWEHLQKLTLEVVELRKRRDNLLTSNNRQLERTRYLEAHLQGAIDGFTAIVERSWRCYKGTYCECRGCIADRQVKWLKEALKG